MRLEVLERGHSRTKRAVLRLLRWFGSLEPDDVLKTAMYRPEFFGRQWMRVIRSIMRGPSDWTPAERELFGTFVSRLNECRYCAGIHAHAVAGKLEGGVMLDELDRWRSGSLPPKIRAVLQLLETVTRQPDAITGADIDAVRAAGVGDEAIVDALRVAFLFNAVNRMANAFGYDFGDESRAQEIAIAINRFNYRVPGFLLR